MGVPRIDQEWTIHSLNIDGAFLERACEQMLSRPGYRVLSRNLPVEVSGHASSLDVLATCKRDEKTFYLLIECKKANPEFIDWVFFLKKRTVSPTFRRIVQVSKNGWFTDGQNTETQIAEMARQLVVADDARET